MPPSMTGPRLAPRSGTAKQLVVFLHGYGADGNDLIEIGRQWQGWLPDAAFVAPNAPEPCAGAPMGRQWFTLTFRDPHERWRGVNGAGPGLDAWLDAELTRYGLDASKLALVGFSQGTMMALHVGLRRARAPAAILGYSGMLVLEEGQGGDSLKGVVRASRRSCSSMATRTTSSRSKRCSCRGKPSRPRSCRASGTSQRGSATASTARRSATAGCSWRTPSACPIRNSAPVTAPSSPR